MSNPLRFLSVLTHDPRPKLFGFATPGAVRAQALHGLENRPASDFLYRHALKDCPGYEPLVRLLDGWKEDGTWGVDRLFMRANGEAAALDRALAQTVRNLSLLHSYQWDSVDEEGFFPEAVDAILSRAEPDGFIQFISKDARWVKGEHSSVVRSDHWGAFAVAELIKFGVVDERIQRYLSWLIANQRDDGGWLSEYFALQWQGSNPAPSHPLHTYAAAVALAAHPDHRTSNAFHRAIDYLFTVCFTRVGPYKRASKSRWQSLAAPDFGQSALGLLELAAKAGIGQDDGRLKPLLEWLAAQQRRGGVWPISRRHPSHKDEESFLTLRAAVAVKRIVDDNTPPKEP